MRAVFVDASETLAAVARRLLRPDDPPVAIHENPGIAPEDLPGILAGAEIAVIESFLPSQMDDAAMQQAVADAVAEIGASSIKDMGKVMAVLKARHAASLDMGKAGPMVKARLSA